MVDIDLFTVVALNMMVLKLGYTGESEPMFYNYLRPLTSLDEGLYALACEEDVRCLATLVRSFKLIEHESSETIKEPVCDSVTPSSLPQHDSDGEAGFADVLRSGIDSSGLSHDESFGVDDLDLNLNEPVNLNVSQVETQIKLPVSEEPDVGPAQEPILTKVSTQEPIVAEVSTQEPIIAEVSIEAPIMEEGNGQEDESARTDGEFFYDDEGIDTAYETEYDVQSSEDACTNNDDDDKDEDLLVDEENEIVEPDVMVVKIPILIVGSYDFTILQSKNDPDPT
ncbi:hypothetical protein Tco_0931041, partial [Tanacetum coccineum]